MPYGATVYNIMIACPGDISDEIEIIREVIKNWNIVNSQKTQIVLMPTGWDTHSYPMMGARPQEIINEQVLKDADLLIAIFWTRIGTPTGESASGTIEEIEKHIAMGKPAMIYFSSAPINPHIIDRNQNTALQEFMERQKKEGRIETYETIDEFRVKLQIQLPKLVYDRLLPITYNDQKQLEAVSSKRPIPPLSDEAKKLLIEASNDKTGTVFKLHTMAGLRIQTNRKNFVDMGNARSEALWEGALQELCDYNLLQEHGYKGETFKITNNGFKIADILKEE